MGMTHKGDSAMSTDSLTEERYMSPAEIASVSDTPLDTETKIG
jgi:hypothetical protein